MMGVLPKDSYLNEIKCSRTADKIIVASNLTNIIC